jgi:sulfinoalanine decarboxylase/sulfinoalanine decarboxylase/aspartate 1-decarboxylase
MTPINDTQTNKGKSPAFGEPLSKLLEPSFKLASWFLSREDELPDSGLRDPKELARYLDAGLGAGPHDAAEVLERMRLILAQTPSSSSWRFLNQLFGGRVGMASAAEMLAVLPNSSMYTLKAAGAQVVIENEVLGRMCAKVGFDKGEGSFVPGGSSANLVALLLARDRAAPGFRDSGVAERRLIAYTSAEAHYSIPKNAGIAGLGRHNVRLIAADEQGRMVPAALEAAIKADLASGFKPFFINATAGTTVRGAFDPIRPLAALARKHGLWLHVDGALGGTMILSSEHKHLVDGSELADSFAWNPHKMMGVPLQTSVILVARKGSLAVSLDETADYLFQADIDEWNPGHRSVQCGRRNDAFKLWAAWYELGDSGWDARIGRQMSLAALAADMIAADPELELLEQPQSICVCFAVKGCSSEAVCDRLDHDGALKIGHGQVRNRRGLRLVCVNPELDQASLRTIFDTIKQAGRDLIKEKQL